MYQNLNLVRISTKITLEMLLNIRILIIRIVIDRLEILIYIFMPVNWN